MIEEEGNWRETIWVGGGVKQGEKIEGDGEAEEEM